MDLRAKTHTILFLQTTSDTGSRIWSDYETPFETLEALIRTYEIKLKELNPLARDVAYTVADIHNFIDSMEDLGVLIFSPSIQAYVPQEREWVKENERIMTLMKGLASNKCAFSKDNIDIKQCNDNPNIAGGFHPIVGIVLCREYLYTKEVLEDTLTHEVHTQ
ncbi:UNVERIFIED_CONTAM: hypothetical protein HDU68_011617 [Siphonaria sp. JEL0065]|nr:hypothetical protein HDU68_011617 [Siphonaria sp. JEL0065]